MKSEILEVKAVEIPSWCGDRIYMHPIDLSGPVVLPYGVCRWQPLVDCALSSLPIREGIGYVTIDEKEVVAGQTHRRGGAHTDGNYLYGWKGGGGWMTGTDGRYLPEEKHKAQYCSTTGGMLITSSHEGCRVWQGEYAGEPRQGGDCEHLRSQLAKMTNLLLEPFKLYWMNSTAIHESLPMPQTVRRSLLRITLPADAPALTS